MADPTPDLRTAAQAVCATWEKTWGKTNVVELENTMAPLIEALNAAALAARVQPTTDDPSDFIWGDELITVLNEALRLCIRDDGQGFTTHVGQLALATREHWADVGPSNIALIAATIADAIRVRVVRATDPEPVESTELTRVRSELYAVAGRLVRFEWLATDIDLDDRTHNNIIGLGQRLKAVIDSLKPTMVQRVVRATDQPSERILPPSIDPERLYLESIRMYGDLGIGVMQAIANGQSLAEVLDFVADHLDGRDHVDDESIALYERAKAVATVADQPTEVADP
jgi:hypothetical protein